MDTCIQSTVGNRGPSVMIWGYIYHGGRRELVVLDGPLNRHHYIRRLRNSTLPLAIGVFGRHFVYA